MADKPADSLRTLGMAAAEVAADLAQRGPLPDSWGGHDLAAAADMTYGAFAAQVAAPLFGLPQIPDVIAIDVDRLMKSDPLAPTYRDHLIRRFDGYRYQFRADVGGSPTCDPAEHYAADIVAEFRDRLDEERRGLKRSVSDWHHWGHCYPEPDDFTYIEY